MAADPQGDRVEVDADDGYRPPSIADGTVAPGLVSSLRHLVDEYGLAGVRDVLTELEAPPPPTFTDDEALAFYRALYPTPPALADDYAIRRGRRDLTRLLNGKWTAPPPLCPPPSPALVELVEAAREVSAYRDTYGGVNRLRAAVAAYFGEANGGR